MRRLSPLVVVLTFAAACTVPDTGPGDEVMGNFTVTAEEFPFAPDASEPFPRCNIAGLEPDAGIPLADGGLQPALNEFSGSFEFTARISRNRDGGAAFVAIGGIPRDAQFDGQFVVETFTAARRYQHCECLDTDLEETLDVALLSTSQNAAAGNECPASPLDGGVPAPTPDGGIAQPNTTPRGFDAVRACGELTDIVRPPAGSDCKCGACWMRYQVRGVRR
ncbi:MAG: hypothetical protein ACJ790_22405 [Myxococcaceae bacterium]